MTLALHLPLAPLLLVQAHRARQRIPKLPEADGPRHGTVGHGPPLRVWIVGDSSAAGVGVATQDQALAGCLAPALARNAGVSLHWRVLARSGLNTQEVVGLVDELLAQAEPDAGPRTADVAVVVTGVNDIVDRLPDAAVNAARSQVLHHLREHFQVRHVVWTPMAPMGEFVGLPQPLRWIAGREAARHGRALTHWIATQSGTSQMNFKMPVGDPSLLARDGFHPGPPLYRMLGEVLAEHIATEVWPSLQPPGLGTGRGLPAASIAT